MIFQPDIGAQGQTNVIALGTFESKLTTLHARKLLERSMIDFDQPSPIRQHLALRFGHVQAIGRPVVRVAVWVNRPKYLDQPITAQMNLQPLQRDLYCTDRLLLTGTLT